MGTRTLNAPKVTVNLTGTVQNTLTDGTVSTSPISAIISDTLENGVSAGECNRAWQSKNRTLSSGGSETLDLYDLGSVDIGAGAGVDPLGQTTVWEEIVAILIKNENAQGVAGILEVEPHSTNGWAPIGTHDAGNGGGLRAQGVLLKYNPAEEGFNVTDASSHQLLITANGGDVTYSIYILARHDDNESSSSSSVSSSSSLSSSSSSASSSSSSSVSSSSSS